MGTYSYNFNGIAFDEMKDFLDEKYLRFNKEEFIHNDPVSVPHLFSSKRDIEISGFLTATISWGRRDLIIASATELIRRMGNKPYEFLMESAPDDFRELNSFYYRTFQGTDIVYFLKALQRLYTEYEDMEQLFLRYYKKTGNIIGALSGFRAEFFSCEHEKRTEKHFADISRGAAGKRLNMFLRWMVRNDGRGVDFGLWRTIAPSGLFVPLDLHTGNIARKLGLLTRKANDWKAVEELTSVLRSFDPSDPVKYDYALFGLGVNEMF
ncbi:MAG: TIGR02757 family protein [Marinilabiliaceae bacterium]|nr:TIGR02757 family protein [Marinilabiliaceae bacterium]